MKTLGNAKERPSREAWEVVGVSWLRKDLSKHLLSTSVLLFSSMVRAEPAHFATRKQRGALW